MTYRQFAVRMSSTVSKKLHLRYQLLPAAYANCDIRKMHYIILNRRFGSSYDSRLFFQRHFARTKHNYHDKIGGKVFLFLPTRSSAASEALHVCKMLWKLRTKQRFHFHFAGTEPFTFSVVLLAEFISFFAIYVNHKQQLQKSAMRSMLKVSFDFGLSFLKYFTVCVVCE